MQVSRNKLFMVLVAGCAIGDERPLPFGTVRPILFGMMDGSSGLTTWSKSLSEQLLTTLSTLRSSGGLRTGPMPDTYNEATRRAEWAATSMSLQQYVAQVDDLTAEGAFVQGLALEVHEELVVELEITRKDAGSLALRFDPVALAHLEAALQ